VEFLAAHKISGYKKYFSNTNVDYLGAWTPGPGANPTIFKFITTIPASTYVG
jgi:hypothetical protein